MACYQKRYVFILCFMAFCTPLFAQQQEENGKVNDETQEEPVPQIQNDESLKLFLDRIEIIGQLEKPQALFFIPGSNPEVDDINIKRSFFQDIFRPVEKKGRAVTRLSTESSEDRKDYIPW